MTFQIVEIRTKRHLQDLIQMSREHIEETRPHMPFVERRVSDWGNYILQDIDRKAMNAWPLYDWKDSKEDRKMGVVNKSIPIGLFVGQIQGYMFNDDAYAAQMSWYVKKRYRGSFATIRLLQAFEAWGRLNGAVEFITGITSHDAEMNERVGQLLQKLGYKHYGGDYMKDAVETFTVKEQAA